jgi:hypothetical protein
LEDWRKDESSCVKMVKWIIFLEIGKIEERKNISKGWNGERINPYMFGWIKFLKIERLEKGWNCIPGDWKIGERMDPPIWQT